jgi:hypothetical protein
LISIFFFNLHDKIRLQNYKIFPSQASFLSPNLPH